MYQRSLIVMRIFTVLSLPALFIAWLFISDDRKSSVLNIFSSFWRNSAAVSVLNIVSPTLKSSSLSMIACFVFLFPVYVISPITSKSCENSFRNKNPVKHTMRIIFLIVLAINLKYRRICLFYLIV